MRFFVCGICILPLKQIHSYQSVELFCLIISPEFELKPKNGIVDEVFTEPYIIHSKSMFCCRKPKVIFYAYTHTEHNKQ